MYAELENSPIGKKLTAAGFAIMNTGGGVMAWGRQTAAETLILIGQGDGELGEDGKEEAWGTCCTGKDADYLEHLTIAGTLDHCIAEMAKVDAPADKIPSIGTRIRFLREWDIFSEDVLIPVGALGTVADDEGGVGFGVKMDVEYPTLAEWDNVVFLNPRDFASDNGMTEAGWVLFYVEPIVGSE